MRRVFIIFVLALVVCQGAWAQSKPSKKEQIAELQSLVEQQQAQIDALRKKLNDENDQVEKNRQQVSFSNMTLSGWKSKAEEEEADARSVEKTLTARQAQIDSLSLELRKFDNPTSMDPLFNIAYDVKIEDHPFYASAKIYRGKSDKTKCMLDIFDKNGKLLHRDFGEFSETSEDNWLCLAHLFSFLYKPEESAPLFGVNPTVEQYSFTIVRRH